MNELDEPHRLAGMTLVLLDYMTALAGFQQWSFPFSTPGPLQVSVWTPNMQHKSID